MVHGRPLGSLGETWDAIVRRVIHAEQEQASNGSSTRSAPRRGALKHLGNHGRPDEICAKGGRKSGPCGGEDDYRVLDAAVNLQEKEQADASTREVPRSVAAGGGGVASMRRREEARRGQQKAARCCAGGLQWYPRCAPVFQLMVSCFPIDTAACPSLSIIQLATRRSSTGV
jgi:hypothetical protein